MSLEKCVQLASKEIIPATSINFSRQTINTRDGLWSNGGGVQYIIYKAILKNSNIDKVILKNIDTNINIDKAILKNMDIDNDRKFLHLLHLTSVTL